MIRPVNFRLNEQTAVNNYYQKVLEGLTSSDIQNQAQEEFDSFVDQLRSRGITVEVVEDTIEPDTPDSIFPNNWVSFHANGEIGLYPMYAENRRLERREDIIARLEEKGFMVEKVVDFTDAEEDHKFLEGTGSMILDRVHKIAYAAVSDRTDPDILNEFALKFGYKPVLFNALQTVGQERLPIYHTNVMMALGDAFAVVCLDSIDDDKERADLVASLEQTSKEVIAITEDQKERFAGNMLQLKNTDGQKFMVMSTAAYTSLNEDQKNTILRYNEDIIHSSLDTIEALGGGSARCMMAEVFLPKATSTV